MEELYRLSLVVFIIWSVCSQSKSEDQPAEHETECQGSVMKLHCLNRSLAITIEAAIYGRTLSGDTICPAPFPAGGTLLMSDEVRCHNDVYGAVKERCDGKMSCKIPINKHTFEDSCPRVYKYLDVAYYCEDVLARGIRHLSLSNKNKTQPTNPQSSSLSTSTFTSSATTTRPSPSVVVKEQLFTTQATTSTPTTSPAASHSTTGSQASEHHSVSVTQVIPDELSTSSSSNTKLHSTTPSSSSPSSSSSSSSQPTTGTTVPKINENQPDSKGNLRTIRLFHFILSFQIVRQEYLQKHPANSFVWFLCGVLSGLHIMIAVFYFLRREEPKRRQPEGKSDRLSYFKQKLFPRQSSDEKAKLRSKEQEVMEMEETA